MVIGGTEVTAGNTGATLGVRVGLRVATGTDAGVVGAGVAGDVAVTAFFFNSAFSC
jgi:hypothetical protein